MTGRTITMTGIAVSRRDLLATGACALVGAVSLPRPASASASGGQNLANEEVVRKWYAGWERRDWGPLDNLLADNFTFSSAAGDDHISKSAFKKQCWETQIDFIQRFDLERVSTGADDAFVKYLCHTKDGKSFRNDLPSLVWQRYFTKASSTPVVIRSRAKCLMKSICV